MTTVKAQNAALTCELQATKRDLAILSSQDLPALTLTQRTEIDTLRNETKLAAQSLESLK